MTDQSSMLTQAPSQTEGRLLPKEVEMLQGYEVFVENLLSVPVRPVGHQAACFAIVVDSLLI